MIIWQPLISKISTMRGDGEKEASELCPGRSSRRSVPAKLVYDRFLKYQVRDYSASPLGDKARPAGPALATMKSKYATVEGYGAINYY